MNIVEICNCKFVNAKHCNSMIEGAISNSAYEFRFQSWEAKIQISQCNDIPVDGHIRVRHADSGYRRTYKLRNGILELDGHDSTGGVTSRIRSEPPTHELIRQFGFTGVYKKLGEEICEPWSTDYYQADERYLCAFMADDALTFTNNRGENLDPSDFDEMLIYEGDVHCKVDSEHPSWLVVCRYHENYEQTEREIELYTSLPNLSLLGLRLEAYLKAHDLSDFSSKLQTVISEYAIG